MRSCWHCLMSIWLHCIGAASDHKVRLRSSEVAAPCAPRLSPSAARMHDVKLLRQCDEQDSSLDPMHLPYRRTQHSGALSWQVHTSVTVPERAAHEKPASMLHHELQPSEDTVFPSSHCIPPHRQCERGVQT